MKKILIIAILAIGFFSVSNAQALSYTIINQSSDTWDVTIEDAGASPTVNELNILPPPAMDTRSGTIGSPPLVPFQFPLRFRATNGACGGQQVLTMPDAGSVQFVCNTNASIQYQLEEVSPGEYELMIRLN